MDLFHYVRVLEESKTSLFQSLQSHEAFPLLRSFELFLQNEIIRYESEIKSEIESKSSIPVSPLTSDEKTQFLNALETDTQSWSAKVKTLVDTSPSTASSSGSSSSAPPSISAPPETLSSSPSGSSAPSDPSGGPPPSDAPPSS